MALPSLFILFITLVILFQYNLRKNTKIENKMKEAFWKNERDSLVVRKKDFTDEDYIHIPDTPLVLESTETFEEGDKLYYKQLVRQLNQLETLDMMNFSDMTNTEIRLAFGTANQTIVQNNEVNYNNYLKTLAKLSKLYEDYKLYPSAISILERCIAMNSDYKEHFLHLGAMYRKTNQQVSLKALITKADALESPMKKGLVDALKSL